MKQKFSLRWLCATILLLCSIHVIAYDFSAKNDDGMSIYYNVVSSTDLTCVVTYREYNDKIYSEIVTIPATVKRSSNGKTYTVVGIGKDAFINCSGLTDVEMPNTITYIDNYAFEGCSGLTSIEIPNSVTTIGSRAFIGCTTLSEITIPSSVVSIGAAAFINCTNLTKVTLEDGEETLAMTTSSSYTPFTSYSSSFASCPIETLYQGRNVSYTSPYAPFREQTTLKSLTIGEDVTTIGGYAFYGCTALEGVSIPNSVTTIEESAFYECSALEGVSIPNSVTSIGDYAFDNCRHMSYANISEGVETIGKYAFAYCYALTELTIPNSVTTIGSRAFIGCI